MTRWAPESAHVGVAQVGYLPGDRILGLSKFARVVDFFSHRAQTQERLTKQLAEFLQDRLRENPASRAEFLSLTRHGEAAR